MRFSRSIPVLLTLTFFLTSPVHAAESATGAATEERQPFEVSTSLQANDPVGDVLTRLGTSSHVNQNWGDLTHVAWAKDEATQSWVVTGTFAEPIPKVPSVQTQFSIYIDTDGKTDNNSPKDGVRGDMDAVWNVKYSDEYGWGIDFRWYNKKPDFWAMDRKTAATPNINGSTISLSIPFKELPATWSPRWRVMFALQSTDDTQIDVVPGVGFPPVKNASVPPLSKRGLGGVAVVVAMAALLGAAGFWFWKRRTAKA